MRRWVLTSLALLLAGITLIVASVLTGESEFGLLLIFPFIVAHGLLGALGSLLLFLAILGIFIGFMTSAGEPLEEQPAGQTQSTMAARPERKYGGVVMIGPIPIVFGSDQRIARTMLIVAIALIAIFAALFLLLGLTRT